MTQSKNFFRNVLDAMMESRARQAERLVANYRSSFIMDDHHADKR